MSESRAAARYAKSLLELASEKKVLDKVYEDMLGFTKICEQNRDFVLMIQNPIITHDKKLAVLKKVFSNANKLTISIFEIITRKNREPLLPAIAREFHNQYNIHKGIEKATVTTAVALDKALIKELESIVLSISKFEKVELEQIIDPDILGGFVLKVGDKQLDDSLRSKLKALNLKFSQNPYIKEF